MRCKSQAAVFTALVFWVSLCPQAADAATITAASCSQSDVQTAINSANSGDTVLVPGPCSPTWSSYVTVTTGITLSGQGTTTLANAPSIEVTTNATTPVRVTGFIFTGPGSDNNGDVSFNGSSTAAPYRLDDCTFTNSTGAVFVAVGGNGTGLIDHNSFTAGAGAEMIHNMALGAGDTTGWTSDVTPGSPNAVYIETNTFSLYSGTAGAGNKALESYYGSRTVFRNNTLYLAVVDQHGTPGMEWARWWEIYNNIFNENVSGASVGTYIVLRGGSGVVWGNSEIGNDSSTIWGIQLEVECVSAGQECSGGSGQTYPQPDQVGRGVSQNLSPAYIWVNTIQTGAQMPIDNLSTTMTLSGRDYNVSSSAPATITRCESAADVSAGCPVTYTYTPFTYPYPLTSNGMPNPSDPGGAFVGPGTPGAVTVTKIN